MTLQAEIVAAIAELGPGAAALLIALDNRRRLEKLLGRFEG